MAGRLDCVATLSGKFGIFHVAGGNHEKRLLQLLQKEQGRLAGNTAAAVYVSSPDLNNLPANIDLHQLAAWTLVARVMLNLDETITKP